jgi:signal transduction histidine kinase
MARGTDRASILENQNMKALTYHGSKDVRVETMPDPIIEAADDIILRVTATAICGSDLHLYRGKVPGMKDGDILGHEFMCIVEEVIQELQPTSRASHITFSNTVPTDLVVFADASLVRRILQNLIGNAIAYTPRGEITIGASINGDDGFAHCWVTDTGKGIPAHLLAQVFMKGKGDEGRAESGGLGLAIVKMFVEAHGGSVQAESVEGNGSTFRFTLPSKAEVPTPHEEGSSTSST